jgi:TonB family protein
MKILKTLVFLISLLFFTKVYSYDSTPQTKENEECSQAILVDKDVTPPILLSKVEPSYPKDALTKERTASPIIVEAVITTDGTVACAKIIKPGDPELGARLLESISKSKYKPATKNGKPIPIRFTVTHRIGVR